jgi:NADPH:quinone reductase-like Zn-dependent oxidoreductase
VILELVGGPYVLEDIACAAPRARIMLAGLMGGGEVGLPLAEVLRKRITITGTVLRSRPIEEKIAAGLTLRKLVASFEKGRLRPVVDTVLPLDRAPCAHERLARNISFGKVILET